MQTIEQRLESVNKRPSGFDYLRLILSISVVAFHGIITTFGKDADVAMWETPLGVVVRQLLPMFFALSGFLVAGSLYRCTGVIQFLGLRAIRIYPALSVEVLFSALVIGPVVTSFSIAEYFTDAVLWQYMWNIIGHIHYVLPGVFDDNPFPKVVNAQLWTVPYELYCYLAIAVLFIAGITRHHWIALAAPIVLTISYFFARTFVHRGEFPEIGGSVPGALLIVSFLAGVALYVLRDTIRWSALWFAVSSVVAIASAAYFHYGVLILPFAAAYCTVYIGLSNPERIKLIQGADYSYGIFLYGFAIQQLVVHLTDTRSVWVNVLVSLAVAVAFSALSWHFVEKPALKLRIFLDPEVPARKSSDRGVSVPRNDS